MRFGLSLTLAALHYQVALATGNDKHTDFVQTCNENGFANESYTVVSDDGYVYQLYRIPGKVGEATGAPKPAVLMMPGLECDMNFWTCNEAEKVPPFVLAEQGYDVWLGNNRGTRYAQYHTELSPDSEKYWQFSQEELGLVDVPTFIDYILESTGQEKLTYIGHSQGTTQMFLGSALNPDYFNEKVNLFVALGPVTKLQNIEVPALRDSAAMWPEVEYLALKFGAYNLFDAGWLEESATQMLCDTLSDKCESLFMYMSGADGSIDDMARYDVFLKDFPAGNGYRNLVYYSQCIEKEEPWQRFDFGGILNMEKYGTLRPPTVPLDKISIPTALFVGTYDKLATVADNEWLVTQLNPESLVWHETYPLGHLSFALAKDMSWFSEDVLPLVDQYATNISSAAQEVTLIETV